MQRILFFFLLAFGLMISSQAEAFRFSPFRVKFEPSGAGANKTFVLENNTDQPASVQVRITTREVDENGTETNADDESDFAIYPPQLVLKPHQKRAVRVQWIGDADLKEEKAFRIVAEQLPVNLDKQKPHTNSVKFLVTYRGALFVTPPGLSSDVSLDSTSVTEGASGKKMLELIFNNQGTQHAVLQNLTLNLKNDKGEGVTLSDPKMLKGITSEGILAGQKRRFLLPWPKGLTAAPTEVHFTFDKKAF